MINRLRQGDRTQTAVVYESVQCEEFLESDTLRKLFIPFDSEIYLAYFLNVAKILH